MKNIILLASVMMIAIAANSQEGYFSLKGRVLSEDSLTPIPNVNIISELSYYGTISDKDGFFKIKAKQTDTLLVSCVGFDRQRVPVSTDYISHNNLIIMMVRSNIMLDSVEIYPYPDYKDFVKDIAKMPSLKPYFVPGVSREDDIKRIYKEPVREPPASIISPISLIYNRFNKREMLKRKLQRNRRRFNKEMERIGADSLMIPEKLDY